MQISLEDLAARAQQGDRASFDELVIRVRPSLLAFLARRVTTAQDADDVAQETLVRAYNHLATYDPRRRFLTWLFAIGKHTAINFRIADHRRERLVSATHPGHTGLASGSAMQLPTESDDGQTWRTARRILGDDAYRALWLRYAHDYKVEEVAKEIGKTVVGTKVLLFRARTKLLREVSR